MAVVSVRLLLGGLLVTAFFAAGIPVQGADDVAFFETKIRPVLVKHCYECHSAQSEEIGGGLRVDHRDGMMRGGESGPALVQSSPDESLLIQALRYDGLEMPPDGPLPPTVVNDFVTWVSKGAPGPRGDHPTPTGDQVSSQFASESATGELWSFRPRNVPMIPPTTNRRWPRDPIDHFVLSRLEEKGLTPTTDANAETLIRRLHYDLIGLQPTREQVDQFVIDYASNRSRAVEALVDSLLASPQFGVRWGRHWLDIARYGESNGDDGLGRNATFPHAWRYRDYVVDAFNEDTPYDEFLVQQIAGDLLPATSPDRRNRNLVATGFLAIGSKPASAMNKNFAMDVVDDQINVVCTTVMGISAACARCHDHKHDPIPTRDYYALAGIFASTETLYGNAGNEKLTAPPTPLHELRSQLTEEQPAPDRTPTPQLPPSFVEVIESFQPVLHADLTSDPQSLTVEPAGTYSQETFAAVKETTIRGTFSDSSPSYTVSFWFRNQIDNVARPITAYLFSRATLGDKALPGDHLGIGGNHDKDRSGNLFVFNGNESKQSIAGSTIVAPNTWNHITLVRDENHVKVWLNGQLEIDGELPATFGESLEYCFANRSDHFAPLDGNLGHLCVFSRALSDDESVRLHAASGQPRGVRPVPVDGYAMGVRDRSKLVDCKIHINGEGNKLGPEVPRGFLTAYRGAAGEGPWNEYEEAINPNQSGRLDLARWLTHPDHPQTARVLVNRVWHHLFGHGIVTTPDDFGVYGARPTHPDLLDYLANRFVEQGWSIKRLIRSIVLTRTYQLDSRCDDELFAADPDNRWLGRHDRRRLDTESLRDSVLRACGTIDLSPGEGSAISELDTLINWPPGEATDLHRPSNHRSIYLCMLRHAPPKELAAFDLPDGVEIAGQRETTTLPTQSLFLLNSRFMIDHSEALARRILEDSQSTDSQRVEYLFANVLHRSPSEPEVSRSLDYLRQMDDDLSDSMSDPDARRRKTWASLCQALLSTNEFRYVD